MPRLDVLHSHALPVEEVAKSLRAVTLVDTLALALAGEVEHILGQLVDAVVDALEPAIHDVDAVVLRVLDQFLHVAAETRQVGGDRRHTHDCALGGCVAPGFVVGAEDAHMRATDEVVVVYGKDGVGGVEELGMEDDLDAI